MADNTMIDVSKVRENFPMAPPKLMGRPTLRGLVDIWNHLCECAMTYRLAASPIGMLYIACNANLWHHWSGGAPPARTANPGDTPFIVQGTTRNDAARIRDRWAVSKRKHNAENSMDEALILRFYECIEDNYAKDIRDDLLAIANPTFLQVFERATKKYGKTTAAQRMETRT